MLISDPLVWHLVVRDTRATGERGLIGPNWSGCKTFSGSVRDFHLLLALVRFDPSIQIFRWFGPSFLFLFVLVEVSPEFPTFFGPGLTGFGPWTSTRSLTNFGDS